MMDHDETVKARQPGHGVDPLFPARWSSRSFSGESLRDGELRRLFEAARWAPSAFNNQSWRFIYAMRDTPSWGTLFQLLAESNRVWSERAAVLMVVVSKETFDHNGKLSRTHSFDSGAAWMCLALQASMTGLVAHCMQGFDYAAAGERLNVPEGFTVEAMIAVGRPGDGAELPESVLARETPNGRKPLDEIAFEGSFPAD